MLKKFQNLWDDESGAIAVEYALLIGAAATVLGVAGVTFYERLEAVLEEISLPSSDSGTVVN